ncbi:MAG: bifunctional (p)ppGpp synthetase/guanosine-3',5'-bis(diphosphate) 3'-pyrophosphohydrolase [Oscillospiraceae bacterium]|nr:bifunctional (p)ppGpp synthetase/guanosine-3',5'-bis(diphosphate) 3'-pyrophosphohydrolase [Oscillospiraceae bacterium]
MTQTCVNSICRDPEDIFRDIEKKITVNNPAADIGMIRAAVDCAVKYHEGQLRNDGSPFVTHVLEAAAIAADMGLDEEAITAAVLHDCIEDTDLTYRDIKNRFGRTVADLVNGVTKLTRMQPMNQEDEQMENLRKMLLAMAKDIRVILIKIADRLHNMQTLEYMSDEKRRLKAFETMEIYAPIAHRLGMQKIKWELEDLALLYLDPFGYKEITDALEERSKDLKGFMEGVEQKIKNRLDDWSINATIFGRLKHIYSIYRKLYTQNPDIRGIFDLCAFRVIVDNPEDCYNVLGHVHDMFKPVPGRFKDYVSTPKPNGYQSIHTTVVGTEGIPFEIQIRSREMHRIAEYGIAAHWKYKAGQAGVKAGDEEKFAWIRRLLERQQDSEAQDFVRDLRIDMFADEVFVFTPRGDVINLTAGATPIDFAYSIHSEVGNKMIGAKVDGRIVPIGHTLQNGNIVEILTSKSSSGPSRDWIQIAKSAEARSKIKQWFKKEKREENIIHGKSLFEAELKRAGLRPTDVTDERVLPNVLKKMAVTSPEDIYASIGYGGMTATRAVNRIRDEVIKSQRPHGKTVLDKLNEKAEKNERQKPEKATQGVLLEGLDNCLIKFSRCCTPVPGDEIAGFITRGYGVSVHRKDCPNCIAGIEKDGGERWIKADWSRNIAAAYSTTLKIIAKERTDFIMDIAGVLTGQNAKVRSIHVKDIEGGKSKATVTLDIKDLTGLKNIMSRLSAVSGVVEVSRFGG